MEPHPQPAPPTPSPPPPPLPRPTADLAALYVDEEEVLGFNIWAAELDLLVAARRRAAAAVLGGASTRLPGAAAATTPPRPSTPPLSPPPSAGETVRLLHKLGAALAGRPGSPPDAGGAVRAHQRGVEAGLTELLVGGVGSPAPVRAAASAALARLLEVGDGRPLHALAARLRAELAPKTGPLGPGAAGRAAGGGAAPPAAAAEAAGAAQRARRLGALTALAALHGHPLHGRTLASGAPEAAATGAAHAGARGADGATRAAGLELAAAAVEGLAPGDARAGPPATAEALGAVLRFLRAGAAAAAASSRASPAAGEDAESGDPASTAAPPPFQDGPSLAAAARALRAVAGAGGGPALWDKGGAGLGEAVRAAVAALGAGPAATAGLGAALGALAACARGPAAAAAAAALAPKPAKRAALDAVRARAWDTCLTLPFAAAVAAGRRADAAALACGWVCLADAERGRVGGGRRGAGAALSPSPSHPALDEGAATPDEAAVAVAVHALHAVAAAAAAVSASPPSLRAGVAATDGGLARDPARRGGDLAHAAACVSAAVRAGALERVTPAGQLALLQAAVGVAEAQMAAGCPAAAAAALGAAAAALDALGEVPAAEAATLREPLLSALGASPCTGVRAAAAAALASLARADPAGAAPLLAACLARLARGVAALGAASGGAPGPAPDPAPAPPPLKGRAAVAAAGAAVAATAAAVAAAADGVTGAACGAASLLVAASTLPLGVPARLGDDALAAAEALVTRPASRTAAGAAAEREGGYTLLGALCLALPAPVLAERRLALLALWQPALARPGGPGAHPGGEAWVGAALVALEAYAAGPLADAATPDPAEQARLSCAVAALLRGAPAPPPGVGAGCSPAAVRAALVGGAGPAGGKAGHTATAAPATPPEPGSAMDGVPPADALFTMASSAAAAARVRVALPDARAYAADHADLARACVRAVRAAGGAGGGAAARVLARRLNPADAGLGPWGPAGAPPDGPLCTAAVAPGAAALPPPWATAGGGSGGGGALACLWPSMAEALLDAQVGLLGAMLPALPTPNAVQVLAALESAASGGAGGDGEAVPAKARAQRASPAAAAAAAAAALAGLAPLAARRRGSSSQGGDVGDAASAADCKALGERTMTLAEAVLAAAAGVAADGGGGGGGAGATSTSTPSSSSSSLADARFTATVLQRAAAELFAVAATIGADDLAGAAVRALARAAAATPSSARRCALAAAVGAAFRSKGGLAMGTGAAAEVGSTLAAIASSPAARGVERLWALHGLSLVAAEAGPAYGPHVAAGLALAEAAALDDGPPPGRPPGSATPGLRPAAGGLANALVSVRGPDLRPGGAEYLACRAIARELAALAASSGRATSARGAWPGAGGTGDAPGAGLQAVLFTQALALFAPGAAPAGAHAPLLLDAAVRSPSRRARRAAAATLRHMAERGALSGGGPSSSSPPSSPSTLALSCAAQTLAALDGETDPGSARQLRAVVRAILRADGGGVGGGGPGPEPWLALLGGVALGRHPSAAVELPPQQEPPPPPPPPPSVASPPGLDTGAGDASDDGDGLVGSPLPAAGPAAPAASNPPPRTRQTAPRLGTRLFACACLAAMLAAPLPPATCPPTPDLLAPLAGEAVRTAFRVATSALDALALAGTHLLAAAVARFGGLPDPAAPVEPGESAPPLLLLQQAQLTAALRGALAPGASPATVVAGAALACAVVGHLRPASSHAPLVPPSVVEALLSSAWDAASAAAAADAAASTARASASIALPPSPYAEWVAARARVALLAAAAGVAGAGARAGRPLNIATPRWAPRWAGLVRDAAALAVGPRQRAGSSRAGGGGGGAEPPPPAVLGLPLAAAPAALAAAAEAAAPAALAALGASDAGDSALPLSLALDACRLFASRAVSTNQGSGRGGALARGAGGGSDSDAEDGGAATGAAALAACASALPGLARRAVAEGRGDLLEDAASLAAGLGSAAAAGGGGGGAGVDAALEALAAASPPPPALAAAVLASLARAPTSAPALRAGALLVAGGHCEPATAGALVAAGVRALLLLLLPGGAEEGCEPAAAALLVLAGARTPGELGQATASALADAMTAAGAGLAPRLLSLALEAGGGVSGGSEAVLAAAASAPPAAALAGAAAALAAPNAPPHWALAVAAAVAPAAAAAARAATAAGQATQPTALRPAGDALRLAVAALPAAARAGEGALGPASDAVTGLIVECAAPAPPRAAPPLLVAAAGRALQVAAAGEGGRGLRGALGRLDPVVRARLQAAVGGGGGGGSVSGPAGGGGAPAGPAIALRSFRGGG